MQPAVPALITAVTAGLAALLAALVLALIGGALWRRNNGAMRAPRGASRPGRAGAGDFGAGGPDSPAAQDGTDGDSQGTLTATETGLLLSGDEIGQPLGERATLLQFSSAFCAPCRATRRILADVAGMTEGVAHVEIDAESRLDLVRKLNVLRTPTVLVLAGDGRVVRRASGQPRKPDVIAALGVAVQDAIPTYKIGKQDSDSSSRPA